MVFPPIHLKNIASQSESFPQTFGVQIEECLKPPTSISRSGYDLKDLGGDIFARAALTYNQP